MEAARALRRRHQANPRVLSERINELFETEGYRTRLAARSTEASEHCRRRARRLHRPMSVFMNPAEFANIHAVEEHFWWYRGMRRILFRMLDPLLPVRPPDRVLEAGCGTGYFSQMLQRERG